MWVGKDEINEELCVDEGEIFENDIFLKPYSHVNYLPLKLMDHVSNILIHNMYELTLVDFLKSLKLKNIPPSMTYNIPRTTHIFLRARRI